MNSFKQNRQNSGITLIALVVTIIVLLILAGVSISMLSGDNGIISKATKAKTASEEATDKEQISLAYQKATMDEVMGAATTEFKDNFEDELQTYDESATVEDQTTKYKVTINGREYEVDKEGNVTKSSSSGGETTKEVTIGEYVNYIPTTVSNSYQLTAAKSGYTSAQSISQENLTWRILNVYTEGGVQKIDIVSNPTTVKVYLGGATGYNNGVDILHNICETLYSNTTKNLTARSINVTDFEKHLTQEGTTARNSYAGQANYGGTRTYTGGNSYYPNLYAEENGSGIGTTTPKTDGISNEAKVGIGAYSGYILTALGGENLTVTQTGYELTINETNYGSAASVLESGAYYWIATRSVHCNYYVGCFGLWIAKSYAHG